MKEWMIRLGIFSIGVGVGVLTTKTYFESKYQAIADEEIESCRAIFSKKKEKSKNTTDLANYVTESKDDVKSYSDYYPKKEASNEELSKLKTLAPVEEEQHEISADEYTDDTEYDKVALNYYTEDGMLIYEEGEEIAIDEKTIGVENLDDFARSTVQTSYFRDPRNEIDYEVIKVDGSYRELIAGDI